MISALPVITRKTIQPLVASLLLFFSSSISVSAMADTTDNTATTATEVRQRIQQADTVRSRFNSGELLSEITLYRNDKAVESNRYQVQFNDNGDSRVSMLDTRSKRQKVLLLKNAMWLFVPRTRKAIRITPMQRLMGQASYGDVASLSWAKEYRWDGQPLVAKTDENGSNRVRIGLIADRQSATYRRIQLWLDTDNNHPIKADFFLASGKQMKSAHYQIEQLDGLPFVRTTRFLTPGKSKQYTQMTASDPVETQFPASLFTRQGFIR